MFGKYLLLLIAMATIAIAFTVPKNFTPRKSKLTEENIKYFMSDEYIEKINRNAKTWTVRGSFIVFLSI